MIPRKVKFFVGKVIHGRVDTQDRLLRKWVLLIDPFYCIVCCNVEEDLDYFLQRCDFMHFCVEFSFFVMFDFQLTHRLE